MIKVCDAIMGTGKSSAAIAYMNDHPNDKFIYITPYLDEANRIKSGCPALHFVEPSNKISRYHFKKTMHTADLIKEGRNITTTHQAFKNYSPDMLDDIRGQGYTLFIDENVDVLENVEFHPDDIQLALDANYIKDDNGALSLKQDNYHGKALSELFGMLKTRNLIRLSSGDASSFFYWVLPPELITAFKDVYVLTYLFQGQSLYYFMKIYDIPYERIGIERADDGGYRFGDYPGYVPEYVSHLKEKLNILDVSRMNDVGDDYYALSMSWYEKCEDNVQQLKKNVSNFYSNIMRDVPSKHRLCGTFKSAFTKIKGKGYTKSFLTFNSKATNAFRDRTCLVYLANVFMNVQEKWFYQYHGIEPDENMYALSIMVQWIWRSAIRDGQEVYLYIPSRRMRTLLIDWMDEVSKNEEVKNG